mmetsp:Transcript_25903/g.36322  ORF Transcript_25903/g.36322 Transcript_25903/m.36322 type:complete len:107 (-) Transcript_25903:147-467(-)
MRMIGASHASHKRVTSILDEASSDIAVCVVVPFTDFAPNSSTPRMIRNNPCPTKERSRTEMKRRFSRSDHMLPMPAAVNGMTNAIAGCSRIPETHDNAKYKAPTIA